MQTRRLGQDGPQIGAIALGCMSFAGFYGPTDEAESHRTLAAALELGVDHWDTSNVYGAGVSETVIGTYLKANPAARPVIATKGAITRQPEKPFDNSAGYLRKCLEDSLKRLGVEHIDLYYIHRRDPDVPIEAVVETLAGFKKEGKIGGIGFSEISPASLRRAAAVHPIAAVQAEYSLWTRLPELGMVQECARQGTTLIAFSPLARGMLTRVIPDIDALPEKEFRRNNPRFVEPNYGYNLRAVKRFAEHAADRGTTPEALALAWLLRRGDHVVPIPGTRSPDHLKADAAAATLSLSDADMAAIEEILPVGFAHGDRYNEAQYRGPERYC